MIGHSKTIQLIFENYFLPEKCQSTIDVVNDPLFTAVDGGAELSVTEYNDDEVGDHHLTLSVGGELTVTITVTVENPCSEMTVSARSGNRHFRYYFGESVPIQVTFADWFVVEPPYCPV